MIANGGGGAATFGTHSDGSSVDSATGISTASIHPSVVRNADSNDASIITCQQDNNNNNNIIYFVTVKMPANY